VGRLDHDERGAGQGSSPPCGEGLKGWFGLTRIHGSSPRVWEIRKTRPRRYAARRFIPTRVGNTAGGRTRPRGDPVHPRACGEYTASASGPTISFGSSPRVWGIREQKPVVVGGIGFIPTRVGNTPFRGIPPQPSRVHPHAYGEDTLIAGKNLNATGSSPPCGEDGRLEIVPVIAPDSSPRMWEDVNSPLRIVSANGSSPHMWGRHHRHRDFVGPPRFIHTHVGKTPSVQAQIGRRPVHPHIAWGRLDVVLDATEIARFSPTRVGRRSSSRKWRVPGRSITTLRGKTLSATTSPVSAPVHPHALCVRPVQEKIELFRSRFIPTRVGRRPVGRRAHPAHRRFIPTHVGKT
jgi:hypothetical protein